MKTQRVIKHDTFCSTNPKGQNEAPPQGSEPRPSICCTVQVRKQKATPHFWFGSESCWVPLWKQGEGTPQRRVPSPISVAGSSTQNPWQRINEANVRTYFWLGLSPIRTFICPFRFDCGSAGDGSNRTTPKLAELKEWNPKWTID